MVFDGMGKPLLENASSVAVSPDGNFTYVSSYNDNAVTVYSRDVSGAPGVLTFVETKKNEVEGVVGMNGVYHLSISPDGNHVYVTGSGDNALVLFNRNAVDGTLTYVTTYWNNTNGIEGLGGANYVDMPADGNHVYVAGPDDNAVAIFSRNVITGELTFVNYVADGLGDVTEMNYPLALMVSPDGKNIYVSSYGDEALNVFERDLITGELSFVEHFQNNVAGISGLTGAYAPYVTPDGAQVYVSGLDDDAIVAFNRNQSSGELTYVDTYVDDSNGVDGVSGAQTIRASEDGNFLFVAASNEDAVGIFSRNADNGVLTFLSTIREGVDGVTGMSYPTYIELSDDGVNMYVTGFASASLVVFVLDEVTGMPTFQSTETGAGLGVSGLDGSTAAAISSDGNFVYVAGNNSDAIVVFSRDEDSGMLTYVQEIEDASATDGLNGINCVAISPDGNYVYTTGFWDKAIVVFERNTTTGMLTYIERYKDGISGVDGLNGANFITVSPDGNNVYTTGFWEHAVAVFDVNANGTLSFVEVFKDGVAGVNGLNRASGVTVSPDGNHIYVAGYNDNALTIFDRAANGTLTFNETLIDGQGDVDGIQRINSVVVSPDNAQVYATGLNDDAVAIFNRDAATGDLTFAGQAKNGVGDVIGLDGPTRLAISANGEHIYVTSANDDAIVALRRNVTNGELVFEGAVFDTDPGVNGLDGAQFVAVTPDGKHMYTASSVDDAVATFSCTYIFNSSQVICEGDSVVVGSTAYLESGLYIDTFSFGACKSVSTLELVVQPANTVLNVEICNGDAYMFNGVSYNTTGQQVANLTSSYGCDSTVTLNLMVVSEFANQTVDANICQGETYPGGYTTTGVYTDTYTTSFGCDSTVTINLTVNPVYNETIDAEICEGDFYILGTQNYIATGTFVESFTTVNGCDSVITLNLSVVEPEVVMNETICSNEVFTIGGNSYSEEGVYNFILESGAGCDSEVTLNLNVNSAPMVNLNAEICQGETYTIGSETFTSTGVYTLVMDAVNGCDSTIVLDLLVNETSTEIAATICNGESYTVGSSTFTTTGVYPVVLTATSGCGDSTVTLTLTVDPTAVNLPASICDGEVYTLDGVEYTETGVYTQTIVSAAGCDVEYTLDLAVNEVVVSDLTEMICAGESITIGGDTYTETGMYTNLMTSSAGCDSTINLNLTVLDPIETTDDITHDNGSGIGAIDLTVSGGMAPYTFNWSNNETTEDISGLGVGTFTVVVTDANGCSEEYSFFVDQLEAIFDVDANIALEIYPNPAPAGGQVNLSFNISQQQTLKIQLYDNVGKRISAQEVDFLSGNTIHKLRLPQVQGLYQIYIETEEGKFKTIPLAVK